MNTLESIIVSPYTPVYLIQNPSGTQANSYVIAQSHVENQKPVSDNLKRFYENSGNIESSVGSSKNSPKPRILKKQENSATVIGNNLKLASFLLPKNDHSNNQYIVNNVILKPNVTASNVNTQNTVPKIDMDRKIVKLKDVPLATRTRHDRILPKIKPKENTPVATQSKSTSVQLIKLGETYHSLSQLNGDQMKVVNQALKIFSDSDKVAKEPTSDPVTNTRFVYKIVTPKNLTVVGKNKVGMKEKKVEVKRVVKQTQPEEIEEPEPPAETKVTRSGRKVKLPKQILRESLHKPKKKTGTLVSCFQCSTEFSSLYRLQKHYENHPTHIPAKIHSNLFHCLLAIIKSGSLEDRTNIFIQQLEQLIVKLKSLLPCLLKKIDGTERKSCNINDDVGRLFGMTPGKYSFDVDALNCVKDKDGYCKHNPPKINQLHVDPSNPTQHWFSHTNVENCTVENNTEDCARINSVAKWPTVSKRLWKLKQQKSEEVKAKRMRLASENGDIIELGMEDLVTFSNPTEQSAIMLPLPEVISNQATSLVDNEDACNDIIQQPIDCNLNPNIDDLCPSIANEHNKESKGPHLQFHSTHFDIRSSPMKPSSTVFRKFQINPEKLAKYESQIIQSLGTVKKDDENYGIPTMQSSSSDALQEIFTDNVDLSCKDTNIDRDLNLKDWILTPNDVKSDDSFAKSNSLIEPSLLHVRDSMDKPDLISVSNGIHHSDPLPTNDNSLSNQSDSVLNFLESLGNDLVYPETEIRNNAVDFQLDLFSFHNT